MAAPFLDHIGKGESAFKSLVDALTLTGTRAGESVSVASLTGQEDDQKTVPRVTCSIEEDGEEIVRKSGIYRNQGQIEIVSNLSDETREIHQTRVKTVMDVLIYDTLESLLSAAVTDYHVYEVVWRGPRHETDENSTRTIYPFEIVHCCTDLT